MKKADSQQILRVIKRLNESQTRWYVAREAISLGRGGIKKMNEIYAKKVKIRRKKSKSIKMGIVERGLSVMPKAGKVQFACNPANMMKATDKPTT